MFRVLAVVSVALSVSACNWVKPIDGSEEVRLLKASEVKACQKLGGTTSFVKNKIAGIERNRRTVIDELITLGKNQAVEMGGNVIVSRGPMHDGKMKFHIFKCR